MQPARRDLRTGTRRPRLNGSDRAVSWHWLLCPRNQDRAPFRFIPKFPIGTPPSELLGVIVICDYAGWAEHKRSRALRRKILAQGDRASKVAANYYFWDGESKLETIIGSWRKRLNRLFEPAEVTSGHSHRLRDTFAVELLLAGVPIVRVSILLGHESVRTTERNYAPWVRSRQEQLEADLTRAWGLDPLIAAQTPQARGTRRVHEKKQRSTSHILRLKIGGAGGIRTHEWRFCRACLQYWPISFQQVRNLQVGPIWRIWAHSGTLVQTNVQRLLLNLCRTELVGVFRALSGTTSNAKGNAFQQSHLGG